MVGYSVEGGLELLYVVLASDNDDAVIVAGVMRSEESSLELYRVNTSKQFRKDKQQSPAHIRSYT